VDSLVGRDVFQCHFEVALVSKDRLLVHDGMEKRTRGMKVDKSCPEDIARTGGAPMDEGE
jgi:hypothetical protein